MAKGMTNKGKSGATQAAAKPAAKARSTNKSGKTSGGKGR